MPAKRVPFRVYVLQPWRVTRRSFLARVHYAMGADVFVVFKVLKECGRQVSKCRSCVRKISIASVAGWRQLVSSQEGTACSSRIEG